MKPLRLFSLACIALVIFACTKKSSETEYYPISNQGIQGKLQTMVNKLMADYKAKYPGYPGGLALKVISKSGSWFVSSGMDQGTTSQVHFRAASNTKTFTSTAILLLAQQGKLNLDAKISDTIPGTILTYVPMDGAYAIPFRDKITIRQLLQHKAGVFDVSNNIIPDTVSAQVPYKGQDYIGWVEASDPTHTFTFDEMVGVDAICRLFFSQPGKGYHYSNTGYSILGKIIERVSGQTYQNFIMNQIIIPMNLTQSTMPVEGTDQQLPSPFAKGFYYYPDIKECTLSNISANVAEGNLITTPDDLSRFLRLLLRGEGVLNTYTVNSIMLAPLIPPDTVVTYTCGIMYTRNLGYGHNGAHEGYLSRMVSDPETDFTAVVFTNGWNMSTGNMNGIIEQLTLLLDESCYKAKNIVLPYAFP
ncbi:MAG: serine hydrolase [Bacteroidetes bacterium]|nr:serine hydrolase [Bacteroidota bacterium]